MSDTPPALTAEQVVHLLRQVDLFRGLPTGELQALAGTSEVVHAPAGHVLYAKGDAGDALYAVESGSVEIVEDPGERDGDRERLALRGPAQAFGAMALLSDAPRTATARAVAPCRLVVLRRKPVQALLSGDTLERRLLRLASHALDPRFAATQAEVTPTPEPEGGAAAEIAAPDAAPDAAEVSRTVQRALLPRAAPRVPGFDVAGGTTAEPAGRGDTVWDWFEMPGGRVVLAALEVQSGALPPSHLLFAARALFRAAAPDAADAGDLLARANGALARAATAGAEQFLSAGLLVIGPGGHVEWSSAGRVPAGRIGREGTFDELGSQGPPLGMMEGFRYASVEVPMGVGDLLLVLSQASLGLLRGAADLVAQVQGRPAADVVATVHRGVRRARPDGTTETSVLLVRRH